VVKVRVDACVAQETRAAISKVVEREAGNDMKRKLPRRARCEIVEMLLLLGVDKYWQEQTGEKP